MSSILCVDTVASGLDIQRLIYLSASSNTQAQTSPIEPILDQTRLPSINFLLGIIADSIVHRPYLLDRLDSQLRVEQHTGPFPHENNGNVRILNGLLKMDNKYGMRIF